MVDFSEFKTESFEQWKSRVQEEIQNSQKDFSFFWQADPLLKVSRYGDAQTHEKSKHITSYFSEQPRKKWRYVESIKVKSATEANQEAIEALASGADGIHFRLSNIELNLDTLLQGISFSEHSIFFSNVSSTQVSYLIHKFPNTSTVHFFAFSR